MGVRLKVGKNSNRLRYILTKHPANLKVYKSNLSAVLNRKGVLDVDTVKGCEFGMAAYPNGGCYGVCYACKMATLYGFDFGKSISRKIINGEHTKIERVVKRHRLQWFRIGTMGDPSHDWDHTLDVCEWLGRFKIPVVVTKHWNKMSNDHAKQLKKCNAVVNTSISPLDTKEEIKYRINMFKWLKELGINSVLRVVSVRFGNTEKCDELKRKQKMIFRNTPIIDNPLRIKATDRRVLSGDIIVKRHKDISGGSIVSVFKSNAYIGPCRTCPDQCGINFKKIWIGGYEMAKEQTEIFPACEFDYTDKNQLGLFTNKVEFEYVKSVIGSGYEEDVARLAIEDKVAYRAARKNMQIHSAIILKINGTFSGFFTFQVNHDAGEFCLLQSAMDLNKKDKIIYSEMVNKIIEQNTYGYPMIMTVSTKHDLENPKVFEAIGFKTYLILSGFHYMVYGNMEDIRIKRLAHATMTNTWTSTKGDWLKMKREWNSKIEASGEKYNIPNPKFASRDGCWQGSAGFSNVVLSTRKIEDGKIVHNTGKSHNKNASVLDPVACECILRFFMPTEGTRVYNPFGGGVQFGYIAGSYGYEYIASEIRQNQCDANNVLCQDLESARWIKSDSATFSPGGKFDLVFTCPPYYKVEKYIDYGGVIPDGEINSMLTYDEFKAALFSGYKIAIEHLGDNRFFVAMVGDSRASNGAYYGMEAETEVFLKEQGLHLYNKIVYLEAEFTRLAQAKRTLDYRKFPKREQKIIVAYKGDMSLIKDAYPSIGRL